MRVHLLAIVIICILSLCPDVSAQTSANGAPIETTPVETSPEEISTFPFQLASQLDFEDSVLDLSPAPEPTQLSDHADPKASSDGPAPVSTPPVVSKAFELSEEASVGVQPIATTWTAAANSTRVVRYEIPLDQVQLHEAFRQRGIKGQLIEVIDENAIRKDSVIDRLTSIWQPHTYRRNQPKIRMVRYEVPAESIEFHVENMALEGQLIERSMLRLPEVRFFQPKARVFLDLKQSNDSEFDLFNDGAILASLDVFELYFPMPLISERFGRFAGKPTRLAALGWRVGGTVGLGISTALTNGTSDNGSAPISTMSTGIRYEFPLGRPSRELLETGDSRLDQRTRVGMEIGVQGGISTRESLADATDVGMYFGILVNTPWGR